MITKKEKQKFTTNRLSLREILKEIYQQSTNNSGSLISSKQRTHSKDGQKT